MKVIQTVVISLILMGNVAAQDVRINGTISHTLRQPVNQIDRTAKMASPVNIREIKLLNIQLSDKAKQTLANKAQQTLTPSNQFSPNTIGGKFPPSIQLGMNEVPVLDQGSHGTCVTFATTAAYDAAMNKGDYISQLCQLQVGNYLSANGYAYSGWDGSLGRFVLSQMDSVGVVSKAQESSHGCGGLHHYPMQGPTPDSSISLKKYHKISDPLAQVQVFWSPMLDIYQAIDRFDTNKTLTEVKSSLQKGDRVTFGVLLLDFDLGLMGAAGKKGDTYDTWVLTPEIARDVFLQPDFGGHEMIITGYDDQATATDDDGRTYQGLLTLRNSWGENLGDHGNFYMSYDYFKLLVIEAQRIHHTESIFD